MKRYLYGYGACTAALVMALTACGTGGGGEVNKPDATPSTDAGGNQQHKVDANPQQKQKWDQELLAYAQCLRKEGWKEAPDPVNGVWPPTKNDGSYEVVQLPDTPERRKAEAACREVLKNWNRG
ncbi:hypothetical protein ACFQVC_35650 [Streptomyces monticola]|uniref:Lipoprotein n=1 Tax=Streptomyces monticola TaxID=2666263 RepID=A0ABW2JTP5_9ACTN